MNSSTRFGDISDGGGFNELHIRTQPITPIKPFPLAELCKLLQISEAPSGVAYEASNSQIADGFAFELADNFWIYGLAPKGNVTVVAIWGRANRKEGGEITEKLQRLAKAKELDLIVWCRAARLDIT